MAKCWSTAVEGKVSLMSDLPRPKRLYAQGIEFSYPMVLINPYQVTLLRNWDCWSWKQLLHCHWARQERLSKEQTSRMEQGQVNLDCLTSPHFPPSWDENDFPFQHRLPCWRWKSVHGQWCRRWVEKTRWTTNRQTIQIRLVLVATRGMLWDVESCFRETLNQGEWLFAPPHVMLLCTITTTCWHVHIFYG